MRLIALLLFVLTLSVHAAENIPSEHAQKTLEIYRTILAMETAKNLGNVPKMANYLKSELVEAGFTADEVEVILLGETAALVARFSGDDSAANKPILFLGHMDVVEANPDDWQRPPFELTEDHTNYYARGSIDNKFGIAHLTSTFIRLKKSGFVPNRDLLLVFSGDEETSMDTTRMLAYKRSDIAEAEFALNSDSGGGNLNSTGQAMVYKIQAAEKTYATWEITVRNPGGHSSRPRPDNAIYDLSDAIKNIQAYRFPVRWSEMTLAFFQETGQQLGGELGEAMIRFAYDPKDQNASDRLAVESSYVGSTRTTCVVTMLRAGHAENAMPQSATATVNCRIFPGVSVAEVASVLNTVVDNKEVEFELLDNPVESPISELRDDVTAAVTKAARAQYPGVKIVAYMASGGTDGMHFRNAGIPTWAVSGRFMNPDEMFAHGLNERVPKAGFTGALDHWSIIIKELAGN
jgi:acetylornithine deacetylase/succinyl-diaminopimelate desuccinylase-like protein